MNKLYLVLSVIALSNVSFAGNKTIFGNDDRLDIYQVKNPLHKKLALSTAGMIYKGAFHPGKDSQHLDIKYATTLTRGMNICSEEKFSEQKTAPSCSGFLIAPDIIVTAGHCFQGKGTPSDICKQVTWVFDYEKKSAQHDPTKDIKVSDVFECSEVIFQQLDDNIDYAVVRLDRKTTGRPSLQFRQSGKIADNTPLVIIGHPMGLPKKVAAGAKVTLNTEETRFSANLDTFKGNSGSPVMNAKTGLVEGILVMGKHSYYRKDHINNESCYLINRCDDNSDNCIIRDGHPLYAKGQLSIRVTSILSELLKAIK